MHADTRRPPAVLIGWAAPPRPLSLAPIRTPYPYVHSCAALQTRQPQPAAAGYDASALRARCDSDARWGASLLKTLGKIDHSPALPNGTRACSFVNPSRPTEYYSLLRTDVGWQLAERAAAIRQARCCSAKCQVALQCFPSSTAPGDSAGAQSEGCHMNRQVPAC